MLAFARLESVVAAQQALFVVWRPTRRFLDRIGCWSSTCFAPGLGANYTLKRALPLQRTIVASVFSL